MRIDEVKRAVQLVEGPMRRQAAVLPGNIQVDVDMTPVLELKAAGLDAQEVRVATDVIKMRRFAEQARKKNVGEEKRAKLDLLAKERASRVAAAVGADMLAILMDIPGA